VRVSFLGTPSPLGVGVTERGVRHRAETRLAL
jgi:hypothetical protein